ncbi:hypothetical protein [Halioxenophilus sp. WMMB6]|uniref:hypothetical protein n=1 Tax=Halioxenophilus sp. WMMB6 TaxID=3073815 RepID=UPI00295E7F94|nr:hypothetical protein [Halioxenophilus sp. WMMB6]
MNHLASPTGIESNPMQESLVARTLASPTDTWLPENKRYAEVDLAGFTLLIPSQQAKALFATEQLQNQQGVPCLAYQQQWLPAWGLNRELRACLPELPYLLVITTANIKLALACLAMRWTTLAQAPQLLSPPLARAANPIAALGRIDREEQNAVHPLWISHAEKIWDALNHQLTKGG